MRIIKLISFKNVINKSNNGRKLVFHPGFIYVATRRVIAILLKRKYMTSQLPFGIVTKVKLVLCDDRFYFILLCFLGLFAIREFKFQFKSLVVESSHLCFVFVFSLLHIIRLNIDKNYVPDLIYIVPNFITDVLLF